MQAIRRIIAGIFSFAIVFAAMSADNRCESVSADEIEEIVVLENNTEEIADVDEFITEATNQNTAETADESIEEAIVTDFESSEVDTIDTDINGTDATVDSDIERPEDAVDTVIDKPEDTVEEIISDKNSTENAVNTYSIRIASEPVSEDKDISEEQEEKENESVWKYTVYGQGYAMITEYTGNEETVCTPQFIDGYEVCWIGAGAFSEAKVTELTISEGIYGISEYAFYQNSCIKKISLPESLGIIEQFAFSQSAVEEINIPSNVKRIEQGTFQKSNLHSITFSDGVEFISKNAFSDCKNIGTITLPETLRFISENVFSNSKIYELNIPGSIKKINENLFFRSDITFLNIGEGIEELEKNALYKSKIENINLPSSIKNIKSNAFKNTAIDEITLPDGIGIIESNAFAYCTLKTLTIEGSPCMQRSAFYECTELSNINISTETPIAGGAFEKCTSLMYINGLEILIYDEEENLIFNPVLRDFAVESFKDANEVGFINRFIENEISKIVDSVTNEEMSQIEKLHALHKWICNKVSYDSEEDLEMSNHVDQALFIRDKVVCEGYARGFALLLQGAGLEAYYVANDTHAWNIVKLGNHYFHVDICYADYFEPTSYDRFMFNDEECAVYNGKWSVFKPSALYNYAKDAQTPECPYTLGDINMDGSKDNSDVEFICSFIRGDVTIDEGDSVLADMDFDGSLSLMDAMKLSLKVNS